MTELPEEVKIEIEQHASAYLFSMPVRNMDDVFTVTDVRKFTKEDFEYGAELYALKYQAEKERSRQMILRLKVEFAGDEYWLNEIDEFLSK